MAWTQNKTSSSPSSVQTSTWNILNYLIFVLLILIGLIVSLSGAASPSRGDYYDQCSRPFICGNINFSFPFSNSAAFGVGPISCGLPHYLIACDTSSGVPSFEISGRHYWVKTISPEPQDRVITVVDTQLVRDLEAGSCESLRNLTISIANLSLPQSNLNLTFIQCSNESLLRRDSLDMVVINRSCSDGKELYLMMDNFGIKPSNLSAIAAVQGCNLVRLPVSDELNVRRFLNTSSNVTSSERWGQLLVVLKAGFPLVWSQPGGCILCEMKGGRCSYNHQQQKVGCLCKGGCGPKKSASKQPIIIGIIASGICSLLAVVMTLSLLIYRKKVQLKPRKLWCFTKDDQQHVKDRVDAENFIRTYRSTMLNSYSYKDLKKMTNGFKEKLGEGGYGIVYKGRLLNGNLIAVKVLNKSGSEGQDFISEVATIGRIHHLNIINLFGFCLEGQKQALIYEYMPNGSLADLLSKKEESISLGTEKLLEIAIGIAHGITYLHGGCDSRILHLDIKPQNILLNPNLVPKISDFGLAKIYSRQRSGVTVSGPRGTFGFIAPEVFMRNLGNPSEKSDVYSFGMLLLEMVGGRTGQADMMKANTSSSKSYFQGWIYDRLNKERINAERSDSVAEEDNLASQKMLMVGIWCIQVNPRDRPSMPVVVEMLSGSVEAIEMPPKPFFFSPPRTQLHSLSDGESSSSLPLCRQDNIE